MRTGDEAHDEQLDALGSESTGENVTRVGPAEPVWVALCAVPAQYAEPVRARLESHGVACHIQTAPAASSAEAIGHSVVCVLAEDAEVARELLARPADPEDPDDDEEDPAEREARLLAEWICPRCHQRDLELLPPSKSDRRWRSLFFGLLILGFVAWISGDQNPHEASLWIGIWVASLAVVGYLMIQPNRGKRCKQCGWQPAEPNCDKAGASR